MIIYNYVSAGDVLPMHGHDTAREHLILVRRGRIKLRIKDPSGTIKETEHIAGELIDTFAGWDHEVVGLEDNSTTIHIQKWVVR